MIKVRMPGAALFTLGVVLGAPAAPAAAQSSIPSYYTQLQYNLTSPGARATAVGGYANPAVYGVMPGFETQYSWTDHANRFRSVKDWGLFFGLPKIGFGVVRNEIALPSGKEAGVNDLRLGFAGGTRDLSVGLGYGWSTGDDDLVGRSRIFQLGLVQRFGRYLSIGAVGNFAIENSNQSGLFDIAIRPLGDERMTLFADGELPKGIPVDDAPWSVGALLEPLPGVQITGRLFDDDSYAFSVGFAFGGLRVAGSPRFDSDNNTTNTTYEIRSGFPERSVFEELTTNDRYYLNLDLKGTVKYRRFKFFDPATHSLLGVLADLQNAEDDPAVRGVAVNLSGARFSRGKAWEIREKLRELRAAGKRVVVFIDGAGMTTYHMASVADRIVLDPEGSILMPGYVMGRTFVRDMLDKIGVGFDEWRFLKYKSAAEAFSRTAMSEADREQRRELLEDLYATVRSEVSESRGVDAERFDEWVDGQIFMNAKEALDLGLVDKLGRWDEVGDVIEALEGGKKGYIGRRDLARARIPSRRWGENPKIAVVYALGVCDMDRGIHARRLEKIFQHLRDDATVDAVVFRVDSPGGDGLASDVAASAMRKCAKKKPVIVSQGDVAASGGYWLSMYADEIYALPMTITGSIGVIGGWVWNNGIGEKLGHTSDHVQVGEHADYGTGIRFLLGGPVIPDRNLTSDERERVMDELQTFYDGFLDKVADGRNLPLDHVRKVAQGRVYSGVEGKTQKLVDTIGGLDAAIRAARAKAGIAPGEDVAIVEYPRMPSFNLDALKPRLVGVAAPFRPLAALLAPVLSPAVDPLLARWVHVHTDLPLDADMAPEWSYIRAIIDRPGRPLLMLPPDLVVEEAAQ